MLQVMSLYIIFVCISATDKRYIFVKMRYLFSDVLYWE